MGVHFYAAVGFRKRSQASSKASPSALIWASSKMPRGIRREFPIAVHHLTFASRDAALAFLSGLDREVDLTQPR